MCIDMGGSHFRERGFTGGSQEVKKGRVHVNPLATGL